MLSDKRIIKNKAMNLRTNSMKRRTTFNYLLMIFCLLICISSCEKNDSKPDDNNGEYSRTNLPDKIGVIPPKSLNNQGQGTIKNISETKSGSYPFLMEEINYVKHYMSDIEIEMMMLDAIFDEILSLTGGVSGSVPENTLEVTYTQEMEDRINELYPGMDILIAGKKEAVPALDLTIFSSDSDGDGYMYKIEYDKSWAIPNAETCDYNMTIRWSSDKTKVYINRDKTLTLDIPPSPVITVSSVASIYDASENKMTLGLTQKTNQESNPQYSFFSSKIVMKETGLGNNEIYYDSRTFQTDEISGTIIDKKILRADDNGGALKIDFYNWSGPSSSKETFDGSGLLLSQSSSVDGIVWNGDAIPDDFTTYVLNSPNLSISGFTPNTYKIYCFVIVETGAPSSTTDLVGFLSSIVGFIVYEKSANMDEVTDSYNWKSVSSTQLFEFDNEYIERYYQISEVPLN